MTLVPLSVAEISRNVRRRKNKERKQKPVLEEQVAKRMIPGKKVEPGPSY